MLADTNTLSHDRTLLAQGLNFVRQASHRFFMSSVFQSRHLGLVAPAYVPSPNIIFLGPSRKNKLQLGESLCVYSSLRRNMCLGSAGGSSVYSGVEQLPTLSLG